MDNSLVRYATGEVQPSKHERGIARRAQSIYDEARLQALEADGRIAVAAHVMDRLTKLDQKRKSLCSPEDTVLNKVLTDIEVEAIIQVQLMQQRNRPRQPQPAPDPWDFS